MDKNRECSSSHLIPALGELSQEDQKLQFRTIKNQVTWRAGLLDNKVKTEYYHTLPVHCALITFPFSFLKITLSLSISVPPPPWLPLSHIFYSWSPASPLSSSSFNRLCCLSCFVFLLWRSHPSVWVYRSVPPQQLFGVPFFLLPHTTKLRQTAYADLFKVVHDSCWFLVSKEGNGHCLGSHKNLFIHVN